MKQKIEKNPHYFSKVLHLHALLLLWYAWFFCKN